MNNKDDPVYINDDPVLGRVVSKKIQLIKLKDANDTNSYIEINLDYCTQDYIIQLANNFIKYFTGPKREYQKLLECIETMRKHLLLYLFSTLSIYFDDMIQEYAERDRNEPLLRKISEVYVYTTFLDNVKFPLYDKRNYAVNLSRALLSKEDSGFKYTLYDDKELIYKLLYPELLYKSSYVNRFNSLNILLLVRFLTITFRDAKEHEPLTLKVDIEPIETDNGYEMSHGILKLTPLSNFQIDQTIEDGEAISYELKNSTNQDITNFLEEIKFYHKDLYSSYEKSFGAYDIIEKDKDLRSLYLTMIYSPLTYNRILVGTNKNSGWGGECV